MLDVSSATRIGKRTRAVAAGLVSAVALVAVLALLTWGAWHGDLPSSAEQVEHVDRLEATVLPVVSDLRVDRFVDERRCDGITYARGDFVDGDPRRCDGSTPDPAPFDDAVRADHDRVAEAVERSGTPVERTGGTVRNGVLRSAVFSSTTGAPFGTSWELLYDPDDLVTKASTDQVTFTPVTGRAGWWFACCGD